MLKNLVYLSIFTTFVVLVWIFLSLYNSFTTSTITDDVNLQIVPIQPAFNTSVIQGLEQKIQIPVNLSETISSGSAKPAEPITLPANLSNPSQVQESSSSGTLPTPNL